MRKRENDVTDKRKIILRLKTGGILAAFLSAAVVFAVMIQMEKNVLTQYEKGPIYTAVSRIPKGQLITEENYEKYFELRQLDSSCIPPFGIRSLDQINGLAAKTDIDQGVLLTQGMFDALDEVLGSMERPVIAGFKAEDLYQVVSGVLRGGDRVSIYAVKEDSVLLVWDNVYVQQVFDASGAVITGEDTSTPAQRINVYLDQKDVERFYGELAAGSLRVVKNVDG